LWFLQISGVVLPLLLWSEQVLHCGRCGWLHSVHGSNNSLHLSDIHISLLNGDKRRSRHVWWPRCIVPPFGTPASRPRHIHRRLDPRPSSAPLIRAPCTCAAQAGVRPAFAKSAAELAMEVDNEADDGQVPPRSRWTPRARGPASANPARTAHLRPHRRQEASGADARRQNPPWRAPCARGRRGPAEEPGARAAAALPPPPTAPASPGRLRAGGWGGAGEGPRGRRVRGARGAAGGD
jgi:hypothetical protein